MTTQTNHEQHHSMNRRSFLIGGGLAGIGALGALTGCAPAPSAGKDAAEPMAETGSAPARSWEQAPDPIPADAITQTQDFDLVVVGAGVGGGSVFMTACEGGLRTALVEKTAQANARGFDIAAVGTKIQKENGIQVDKAAVLNDLVTASSYKANGALIKLWADESGRVLDDLIDMVQAQGYSVGIASLDSTNTDADGFWNRTHPVTHNLGLELGGLEANPHLLASIVDRGIAAGGEVFYECPAEQLVVDGQGQVTGVICKSADGYVQFNGSKGVVLATGDYSGNPDMLAEFSPMALDAPLLAYNPQGANTGDGLNMAFWVGAGMQKGPDGTMIHPTGAGGACGTYSFLRVNKDGKRFCNEDTAFPGITNAYLTLPDHVMWTVMDAHYAEQIPQMTALSRWNGFNAGPFNPADNISPEDGMRQMLEGGTGDTVTADTLEGLAEAMGVPADALKATVDRYNELAAAGRDEDFGKDAANLFPIADPPFYASTVTACLLVCTAGLNVDSNLRVCSDEGTPIAGLYAVGNAAGNFFANDYPMCCPGISHGRAITLGYVLGESLAANKDLQA